MLVNEIRAAYWFAIGLSLVLCALAVGYEIASVLS